LLAIGAGKGIELSPLQVATAYTIFPNSGLKTLSRAIWAVYDGEKKVEIPETKSIRVVNGSAASTLTEMLQSVVGDGPDGQYGTARMARELSGVDSSVALAGKTGTSDSDLWFVGLS